MSIQEWLGVAIDGIAGPQTNGAMKTKMPTNYATYGPINPANVDKYIAAIGRSTEAVKAMTEAEKWAAIARQAQAVMNADGTVQLSQGFTAHGLILDKASGSYKDTGSTRTFPKGFEFGSGWYKSSRGDRSILLREDGTSVYYEFPPGYLFVV